MVSYKALPETVQQSFITSHKNAKVKAVAKIETSEGATRFEIEVKQLLGAKELFYDTNGKELQDDDKEN